MRKRAEADGSRARIAAFGVPSRIIQAFVSRLRGRADSEHEQALIRLAMVLFLVIYYVTLYLSGVLSERSYALSNAIAAVYLALSLTYIALIVHAPRPSPARRLIAMITDIAALSVFMHVCDAWGAPLYPIYLWITLGNGFRYGVFYLGASAFASLLGFLAVTLTTDYWSGPGHTIHYGLLLGLVIVPAYAATLIRKLTEAKVKAEAASHAKSRFLATMSHELRTPLNAVTGMTELLHHTRLEREQREMLGTIQTSARALLALIDDILDLSRIEADRMTVERADFDLNAELAEVAEILRPQAETKGLSLTVQLDPALPETINGDRQRLRQILMNLVSNAIKFTESGGVLLSVAHERRDGKPQEAQAPDWLRVRVSDTGPGISHQIQACIFESFTQADDRINRRYGGSGLGLTISRQFAELLQGRLWVESESGAGSTFHLALPLNPARADASTRCAPERSGVLHALVSPDPALAGLLQRATAPGQRPKVFASVAASEGDRAGLREGVICLDLRGLAEPDCRRRLESLFEALGGAPKGLLLFQEAPDAPALTTMLGSKAVAVLTSAESEADARRALGVLGRFTAVAREAETVPEQADLGGAGRLRVLFAEDNPVNRMMVEKILERAQHETVLVDTADDALDLLEEQTFDIVLMDVNMPGTSGIEAAKLYRMAHPEEAALPIIALTADVSAETQRQCAEAGMTGFLAKPVDSARLLQMIETHARRRGVAEERGAASASHPPPSGARATPKVTEIASHPAFGQETQPAIDIAALDALAALDPESDFLEEIVAEYLRDSEDIRQKLTQAFEAGDAGEFRNQAHALRSSSVNLGALQILRLAGDLNAMGETEMRRGAVHKLSALGEALDAFRRAAQSYLRQSRRSRSHWH